jgi:flagellar basal-body rod protein FlgC
MDVIAMNIANAETTRTADGGPYRRQVVELRAARAPASEPLDFGRLVVPKVPKVPRAGSPHPLGESAHGVEVGGISVDSSEGPLVYDPGHPDADESGYVRYPNVNLVRETIDLMEARRAYEANATVFEAMKAMLQRALRI